MNKINMLASILFCLTSAASAQSLNDLKHDGNSGISNPAIRQHVSPDTSV